MTMEPYERESFAAIDPVEADAYLRSRGWQRLEDIRRLARWVRPEDEDLEVLVPLEARLADFTARIRDLVLGLSLAEERSPESVLRDLLAARVDTIRIRVQPRGRQDGGGIPLEDGVTLVEEARNLLVAAARSAVSKKAHHPTGPRPMPVRQYLAGVHLGQTERGSYVVTMLSAVDPSTAETERDGRLPQTDPFPRRVVELLADATDTARRTAEQVAAGDGTNLDPFLGAVQHGVSANLCDSLAAIGAVQRGGFTISFGWAPIRPAPGLLTAVEFGDRTLMILVRAAKLLARVDVGWGELRGRVKELRQPVRAQGPWRITIEVADQTRRRVVVDVDAATHARAIQAYRQEVDVIVEGLLVRDGRTWRIAEPRDFRVLDQ